jgi:hypothetical protein
MQRHLAHRHVGIVTVVLFGMLIGLGTVGNAHAQAFCDPYGFVVLGAEIQTLQTTINTLQTKVDALQNATAPRRFYLTKDAAFDGSHALTACALGFHMASLFEIFDPTTLQYDSNLGFSQLPPALSDIGAGPPNRSSTGGPGTGWIRTGNVSGNGLTAGTFNCNAYTSNSLGANGTIVALNDNWNEASQAVSPWRATTEGCNRQLRVWCVEDR